MMADQSDVSSAAAGSSLSRRVSRDAQAHSSEPWTIAPAGQHADLKVQHAVILNERGQVIAAIRSAKDARRIVACVNACQGISTEALERGWQIHEILLFALGLIIDFKARSEERQRTIGDERRIKDAAEIIEQIRPFHAKG